MKYLEPTLDVALKHFRQLTPDSKPLWGSMTALDMVEHITDSLDMAQGKYKGLKLHIPEEKTPKALQFLFSEHPMPKNFKAPFGPQEKTSNRNASLEEAISEFEVNWNAFEKMFNENPELRNIHPNFGNLNYEEWLRVHSKHLTHHCQQFGLIPS
ncbi:MAG: DinB family protein [Fluviicola sp.]